MKKSTKASSSKPSGIIMGPPLGKQKPRKIETKDSGDDEPPKLTKEVDEDDSEELVTHELTNGK